MPPKRACRRQNAAGRRAQKTRGGVVVATRAGSGVVTHDTGTVEDDREVVDVCLESITIHLDGVRTRYGFIEDASLRTRRSPDVSLGGSTADVAMTDEYTLQEVVELCDNPQNKVAGVVVDPRGLENDALNGGRVRCWFVYESARGVDYTESANDTGYTWARTRYRAPPDELERPLYKAANFLEPACLTSTCELGRAGLSSGCEQTGIRYCRRDAGNMRSKWCSTFFASKYTNVDDLLRGYCADAVAKVLADGGRLRDLDPRDRKLCSCFYPTAIYNEYFKYLKNKSHQTAPCSFSPCANSDIHPFLVKKGTTQCPTVVECNQRCEINTKAHSVGRIECNQECNLTVALEDLQPKGEARAYAQLKRQAPRSSSSVGGRGGGGDDATGDGASSSSCWGGTEVAGLVVGGILLACLVAYAIRTGTKSTSSSSSSAAAAAAAAPRRKKKKPVEKPLGRWKR